MVAFPVAPLAEFLNGDLSQATAVNAIHFQFAGRLAETNNQGAKLSLLQIIATDPPRASPARQIRKTGSLTAAEISRRQDFEMKSAFVP